MSTPESARAHCARECTPHPADGRDRGLWHAITEQKNIHFNTNGGGYIWIDPEQQEHASAKRTLPSPSSYAGFLLGLRLPPDAATAVVPATLSCKSRTNQTYTVPDDL